MDSGKWILLSGAGVLALVGLAAWWGAWQTSRSTRAFLADAVKTEGVVRDLVETESRSSDGSISRAHYPRVEYQVAGQTRVFQAKAAVDPYEYPVGESIGILYRAGQPEEARLADFNDTWGTPVILGIFGTAFLGGAVLVYLLLYREIEVNGGLLVGSGFALAAVLLGWLTWKVSREPWRLAQVGVRVEARVGDEAGPSVVEFQAGNGRSYRCRISAQAAQELKPGDRVPVVYDPERPARARHDTWDSRWLATLLAGGFTLLCGSAAVFAFGCCVGRS